MAANPTADELRKGSFSQEWLGPAIYSSGPITDGDPPVWPIARIVRTPADAVRAVADDKAAAYIGIKVYDALSPALYDAIVDAAEKARLDVIGHIPDDVGLAHAIAAHQWTIEHTDSFLLSLQPGAGPYAAPPQEIRWRELVHRADLSKLPRFADDLRRNGIWTCPTVVVQQLDATSDEWTQDMRYVPGALIAKLRARYPQGSHDFPEDLAFALAVVAGLHARGAGILLGSDAFKVNVAPGFSALQELDYFVRTGMTAFEALQTGTINAAQALHEDQVLGTVAVGKRADLLLLTANPLVDVRNVRQRAGVVLRGRWLPESELRQRLARVAQAAAGVE